MAWLGAGLRRTLRRGRKARGSGIPEAPRGSRSGVRVRGRQQQGRSPGCSTPPRGRGAVRDLGSCFAETQNGRRSVRGPPPTNLPKIGGGVGVTQGPFLLGIFSSVAGEAQGVLFRSCMCWQRPCVHTCPIHSLHGPKGWAETSDHSQSRPSPLPGGSWSGWHVWTAKKSKLSWILTCQEKLAGKDRHRWAKKEKGFNFPWGVKFPPPGGEGETAFPA